MINSSVAEKTTPFFFNNNFYHKIARVPKLDATRHYIAHGASLGLKPHPFFAVENAEPQLPEEPESMAKQLAHTSVLFDAEFCAQKNNININMALNFASNSIADNKWVDFHPLLTRADFEASGLLSIAVWLDMLHRSDCSLIEMQFDHFMPGYYRKTSREMKYENELIDYLSNGQRSGGLPHVFFVPWYPAQFWDDLKQARNRQDSWLDMLADLSQYGRKSSPFFEPLEFNHQFTLRNLEVTEGLHPLTKFIQQKGDVVAPMDQVLPTALAFSFLDRSIDNCGLGDVSGRDLVDALEVALTGSTTIPEAPNLTICILNYNKPVHSVLSAMAAARNAPENSEVLVLDNGSNPKDYELICLLTRQYGNIRVIRSQRNLFFGEGNNILLDQARSDKILFLNNDAYVGPTTIVALVAHLDANPDVAACGCTFLFPDLRVQEAGGVISDCGQQLQLHKNSALKLQRQYAANAGPHSTQYISSACFCVRRSVLEDVGGYDALYEPLYFEDSDLCKRITSAGYQIDYLPDQYVIHFENASTREFLGEGFMSQINKNREKFRNRWLYQPQGYRPRTLLPQIGRAPDPARPLAIVYTPYNLGIGGGERYTLSIVAELAKDHNVILATAIPCSRTRVSFAMSDLGIELTDEMIINVATIDEVAQGGCDLMVVIGNEAIPPVTMFGKRNIYHCQFPFPGHHEDRWQSVRLNNIDAVIVNSEFTRFHLELCYQRLGVDIPLHITYAPVKYMKITNNLAAETSPLSVVSVGRFDPDGHGKRQDVAIEVLKKVHHFNPDVQLKLVGGLDGSPRRSAYVETLMNQAKSQSLPVEFRTNASRSELEEALAASHIYFHACGFGADLAGMPEKQEHFGISVVEGMMIGLIPIVFDGGGPAEITRAAGVGFRYRSIEEAADAVQTVAAMPPQERELLGSKAKEFARRFTDERFQSRVRKVVDMVKEGKKS